MWKKLGVAAFLFWSTLLGFDIMGVIELGHTARVISWICFFLFLVRIV